MHAASAMVARAVRRDRSTPIGFGMISSTVAALADSALLLPASLLVAVLLASRGLFRLALAWCAALALAGAATLASKLLFNACGHEITTLDLVSPSGHASFATVFYGGLAILLGTGRPAGFRWILALGTGLFIVAVGISRVRTDAHSPVEVVIGVAVGAAALALFAVLHARTGSPTVPLVPVAAGLAVLLVCLGGLHLNVEGAIRVAARRLSTALDVCARPERTSDGRLFHLGGR